MAARLYGGLNFLVNFRRCFRLGLNHTSPFAQNRLAIVSQNKAIIRGMQAEDAAVILEIYSQGIQTGHATFASEAPSWQDWDDGHLPCCRLVAQLDGEVVGWAALSPVASRCVYAGVAEVSLYVAAHAKGHGLGSALMENLVGRSEADGIWTLQAGIFPENYASLALHERYGFVRVGMREKLGKMSFGPMAGQWRDVVFLERRSRVVGTD